MFLTCPSHPVEHITKLHERKYLFKKVSNSQDAIAEIVGWFFYKPLQGVNCIQGVDFILGLHQCFVLILSSILILVPHRSYLAKFSFQHGHTALGQFSIRAYTYFDDVSLTLTTLASSDVHV